LFQTDRKLRIAFLLSATALWSVFLRIRLLGDLRARVPETVTWLVLASLFYLVSCYLAFRVPTGARNHSFGLGIAAAGLIFRLTVWPLAPALSDDLYRYRWEGKLQTAGGNPYESRPADARWTSLRDASFPLVVGKDFKAVYGPLIEQIELWTYRAVSLLEPDPVRQVFWFKLPFALCDLGVIAVIWMLLGARGLPREHVLIYAWSPLAIIEFWATGHNDSVVVLLLALALLGAAKERWTWAFAALSLAVAAKIWPILLFPLFIGWRRNRPKRLYQWWVAFPIFGLFALPYWTNVRENMQFASGFVGGWRNNDSLFGIILWAAKDVYRAKYAAFAIVAIAVLILTVRQIPLERACLAAITILLMVSANCHPWYLTWLLPLLVLFPVPALLLWTALAPLAYSAVISWVALGEWQGSTAIRWYEYVPVYSMLIGCWLVSRLISYRKSHRSSAHIAG
jgi:alpha-1,6-mannosyltransferase